jgi:hypothetical protein
MNNMIFENKENNNNITQNDNLVDMETLINNLKHEDSRSLRMMNRAKWIYSVMVIVYFLSAIIINDTDLLNYKRVIGLCNTFAFLIFAYLFWHYHKVYNNIDYSNPIYRMLKNVVDRYSLSAKKFILLVPALLLIDIGQSISFYHRLSSMDPINRILYVQLWFIPLIIISALIGIFVWKKRKKPLLDRAKQMLKELEE